MARASTPEWYEPHEGVKQGRRRQRREKVRQMYLMGFAIGEISEELGVADSTVTNDITAMGIANRSVGSHRIYNPVKAISSIIGQMDNLAHALNDVLERLARFDYKIDQDTLEVWSESLNRRDNITASVTQLRRYMKEQQE